MNAEQLFDLWLSGEITWDEYEAIMNARYPLSPERAAELRAQPYRGVMDAVIDRMEARREAVQA